MASPSSCVVCEGQGVAYAHYRVDAAGEKHLAKDGPYRLRYWCDCAAAQRHPARTTWAGRRLPTLARLKAVAA